MQNEITDTSEIRDAILMQFNKNPIVEYIVDEFICDGNYSDVKSLITDLEMAHCAAGSFSGMIYTQDILDRLADSGWRNAIEKAIEDYTDATGESPTFDHDAMGYPSGFHLENLVTFAVDWMSNEIASFLRSNGQFYIVTQAVDSLDPSPERKVFLDEYDAQEYVQDSIDQRLQLVGPEQDIDAIEEQERELIRLEEETV
jgi:hypothetical protein